VKGSLHRGMGKVWLVMGLQQFEQRLEQLVEGVFARAFRGGLQPVELGRRLVREMDLERTMGVRGLIAPNRFVFTLAARDLEKFSGFADALVEELREAAREHARTEKYHFVGPLEIFLEGDRSVAPGTFRVSAEVAAGPGAPQPCLVLPDGSRVEIGDDPLVIGRLPECSVVLTDPNVSRRHAEVRREAAGIVIADLGSTNGTLVNGTVTRRQALADGDEVTVGSTVLRFENA